MGKMIIFKTWFAFPLNWNFWMRKVCDYDYRGTHRCQHSLFTSFWLYQSVYTTDIISQPFICHKKDIWMYKNAFWCWSLHYMEKLIVWDAMVWLHNAGAVTESELNTGGVHTCIGFNRTVSAPPSSQQCRCNKNTPSVKNVRGKAKSWRFQGHLGLKKTKCLEKGKRLVFWSNQIKLI